MNLLLALLVTTVPLDTATFAGGCFWSMERAFDQVAGVVSVTVGYTGGRVPHPSYEQVSTGQTGHLESVQVVYDARKHGYERLVDAFWHNIDPTQADGQFCDHGPEYHTAIFYRDSTQHSVAAASRRALEQRFKQPIATEIVRAGVFYRRSSITNTTTARIRFGTRCIARGAAATGGCGTCGAPTRRTRRSKRPCTTPSQATPSYGSR